LGLAQTVGFGVEPGKPSYTAESCAAFRAIAALDPDEKIRNPDYLAEKFVSPEFWDESGFSLDFEYTKTLIKIMQMASYYWINARTKHIDAILKGEAAKGIRQVVILGAGYDSRAYRFRNVLPEVRFFEVDLPATLAQKKKLVADIIGSLPDRVAYVPIDFNTQTLEGVLKKAGYEPTQKTLFIWEGVTPYITEQGVDNTLSFIADHSAPGSSVIFDYVLKPVIEGTTEYYKCREVAALAASKGEPWIFGIGEGEAENFVNQRGLVVLSDLRPDELTQQYLVRSDGSIDGRMLGCVRILHASVPGSTSKKKGTKIEKEKGDGSLFG
jgi:methyltransferase (TIGR00027 family)